MRRVLIFLLVVSLIICSCEMKKKKKSRIQYPTNKQLVLQRKETTPVDFTRLLVMRLFYGVAKLMGFEEPVGEILNGALVPPGADDDDDFFGVGGDDDDEGFFGGGDDY